MVTPSGLHYFNHAQKLFQIGESATLAVVTWGIAGVSDRSYRTLFAMLDDEIQAKLAKNMQDVADRWIELFWKEYENNPLRQQCLALDKKKPFDPAVATPDPTARTKEEEQQYRNLLGAFVGFCLAGYVLPSRVPQAYQILFYPVSGKPSATEVQNNGFWGAPNMIERLIAGRDGRLEAAIVSSGKWAGTPTDLQQLLNQFLLPLPTLPAREAVDFVYSCIHSTIKALKFSNLSQICGGPIEIAIITTDRKFRWVRHKAWDVAITEGDSP